MMPLTTPHNSLSTTDTPRGLDPDDQGDATAHASTTDLSILDLMVLVAEHLKWLVLGPLAAGLLALGISFMLTPTYVSTARILPPQQTGVTAMLASQMGALAGLAGAAAGIKSPADQFAAMLRSRTIFDGVIERFDLRRVYGTEHIEETRKALDDRVSVTAGVKDGLITVEVEDADPKRAAEMANTFISLLAEMIRRLPQSEASQRRLFFEKQLADARANLEAAEIALRTSDVDRDMLKSEPRAALEELARLKAAMTMAELKVASLRGFLAESSPDLKQAQQELAAIRAQLVRAESGGKNANAPRGDYIRRFRDFKYNELLFELMARQYELARLDESRDSSAMQVIDVAVPAEWKSRPKRALIAVVTTIATGLLLFGALVIRNLLMSAESDPGSALKVRRLRQAIRVRKP